MRTCRRAGSCGCSPFPSERRPSPPNPSLVSRSQPPVLAAGRCIPPSFLSRIAFMLRARTAATAVFRVLVLTGLVVSAGAQAVAEEPSAYVVEVSDVTAKVGEPVVMRATLRIRDGYRILRGYNNRVIELSSFDDGVAFERKIVPATLDEDALRSRLRPRLQRANVPGLGRGRRIQCGARHAQVLGQAFDGGHRLAAERLGLAGPG